METFTYDNVPYICYPFAQTHPDRLATIGTLLGMQPTPLQNCRVLELGCGDGANLLPMAAAFPQSQFVGIDLAVPAIQQGQAVAAELGIRNLELIRADLLDPTTALGKFDYIIAHGVYSWVPAAVRDRMLEICREQLTPQGIAYISYNAYPGCYLRQMTREMMQFHVRDMQEPEERVTQGLSLLKFLLCKFPNQADAKANLFGALLTEQLDDMEGWRHRATIYHDDLADINDPFYFHQFVAQAGQFGLQYLSEANFYETQYHTLPAQVREMLDQFGDENILLREQYLDFLKCRTFRQTLLCHQDIKLERTINPQRISEMFISTPAQAVSIAPNLRAGVIEEFTGKKGARLQTDFPLAKAALIQLQAAAPTLLKFDELAVEARKSLEISARQEHFDIGEIEADATQVLAEIMLAAYRSGMIELHLVKPEVATVIKERPEIFKLARWQAGQGNNITTALHQSVEIEDPLSLQLLCLLDGTRNWSELVEVLVTFAEQNEMTTADGQPITDEAEIRQIITANMADWMNKILTMGVMVA